jgi:hypothetical protein
MYHYDQHTATPEGEFTDGDRLANPPVSRTLLYAKWPNMIQRELLNVLAAADVEPDQATFDQVAKSILALCNRAAGHVGELKIMVGAGPSAAPQDFFYPDGPEFNRATYAELWDWAQEFGRVVPEADWQSNLANRPSFSDGDGATTFRAPDLRGLFWRFLGGGTWDAGRQAGTMQEDALQNIVGSMNALRLMDRTVTTSGAFEHTVGSDSDEDFVSGNDGHPYSFTFDASRVARTAAETRAINAAFPAFIRYRSLS